MENKKFVLFLSDKFLTMQTYICSQCRKELDFNKDNFYFRKNGKLATGRCRTCSKAMEYAKRHKDQNTINELKIKNADYYRTHREKLLKLQIQKQNSLTENGLPLHREIQIKKTYGLSGKEYKEMLDKCDSKCTICGNELIFNRRNTHIDHCHKTGKVRGILCTHCNRGLGGFKDNIDILENAITYLKRFL